MGVVVGDCSLLMCYQIALHRSKGGIHCMGMMSDDDDDDDELNDGNEGCAVCDGFLPRLWAAGERNR